LVRAKNIITKITSPTVAIVNTPLLRCLNTIFRVKSNTYIILPCQNAGTNSATVQKYLTQKNTPF